MAIPMLQECFRWFGPADPVPLSYIRQTGVTGVYTSLHHIPYGELWTREEIRKRLDLLAPYGLEWTAVESVPVSEAIKTRGPDLQRHLDNYAQTLENLGAEGIRLVIYNFMPALDWVRTDLAYKLSDGSETLFFDPVPFAAFEVHILKRAGAENDYTPEQLAKAEAHFHAMDAEAREKFARGIIDVFPGVKMGLSLDGLRALLARYQGIDADHLRENLAAFLRHVLPAAERAGIRMAIHPDDPPFSVLGLSRIVSTGDDLRRIVAMSDSPANGVCYCTGSLGVRADNDLPGIVRDLGSRIHAVHLRMVQRNPDGSFIEAGHLEGSSDMPAIVAELLKENARRSEADRLSFRPDHGRRMLDDLHKPPLQTPGYDAIGRLRGLAEIRGLQTGLIAAQRVM